MKMKYPGLLILALAAPHSFLGASADVSGFDNSQLAIPPLTLGQNTKPSHRLPSKDPGVVLPLLENFKSKPTLDEIRKILGSEDMAASSGAVVRVFTLTDHTVIVVFSSLGDDIISIERKGDLPLVDSRKPQILYPSKE